MRFLAGLGMTRDDSLAISHAVHFSNERFACFRRVLKAFEKQIKNNGILMMRGAKSPFLGWVKVFLKAFYSCGNFLNWRW